MPSPNPPWRFPRVHLTDAATAILRTPDGQQQRGRLEVVSLSGGLLNMSTTLEQGSRLKLMFMTQTGPVLGGVEMLPPVSSDRQPFRFIDLEKSDQYRLRDTVQSFTPVVQDAWIEKYRSATINRKPEPRGFFRGLLRSFFSL